jgi:predicted transcriptional regulator
MNAYGRYKMADAKFRLLHGSVMRTKAILSLIEGEMSAKALSEELACYQTTCHHILKELNDECLVIKSAQGYMLSNTGRIQARILDEYVSAVATLDQFQNFFLNHDISFIPSMHQKMIGMLYQQQPMEFDYDSPFSKQEYLIKAMREAKEIHCVSSVIAPRYAEAVANSVRNGAEVDLVLTDKIFQTIQGDHSDLMNELFGRNNLRFRITNANDIKIAFTVTESTLFLGLYRIDGCYDMENILICKGEQSRRWGLSLFEYYCENSKLVMP